MMLLAFIIGYVVSIIFSGGVTALLARKLGDFPEDRNGQLKVYLMLAFPVVNVIYSLAILPYFFSNNPYGFSKD